MPARLEATAEVRVIEHRRVIEAVAIVKKRLKLEASLYTLLQVLSVTLFEKLPLDQALTHDAAKGITSQITNQLDLFAF